MRYRVLVTGSRGWADPDLIYTDLDDMLAVAFPGGLTVVEGGCQDSPDLMARQWAEAKRALGADVTIEEHPITDEDWARYGRAAGPRRNAIMLESLGGYGEVAAFISPCTVTACRWTARGKLRSGPHGTHGSSGCVLMAWERSIPVTGCGDGYTLLGKRRGIRER